MKRRTFLKALGIGVSLCFIPELASAETPEVPELQRYRVLQTLPAHGHDAPDGGCRFDQRRGQIREGDIIVRTGELDLLLGGPQMVERLFNETQGIGQWFYHTKCHFWSDAKNTSGTSSAPVWFERIS
jgi:hypothetical protein